MNAYLNEDQSEIAWIFRDAEEWQSIRHLDGVEDILAAGGTV